MNKILNRNKIKIKKLYNKKGNLFVTTYPHHLPEKKKILLF